MNGAWGIVGAVISVIGTITMGVLTYRGTRTAARINVVPTTKQVDLSVLQASVERLEKESGEMREQIRRLRSMLWAAIGWAKRRGDQVERLGGVPDPTPDEIEEFYRTGV
ncbi:hypothetical protein GCM10010294_71010 [Streptomyces griseoloalbus]|uniref:hypothetical protein n=1 Tax=Streptomyces griseoloalbus TaxID=67303 RepID=UPI0018765C38|nr:hypothetical protein GCM10010294_71010 [Streptomyces griseoloalbus]